jgi:hypothetical protein
MIENVLSELDVIVDQVSNGECPTRPMLIIHPNGGLFWSDDWVTFTNVTLGFLNERAKQPGYIEPSIYPL